MSVTFIATAGPETRVNGRRVEPVTPDVWMHNLDVLCEFAAVGLLYGVLGKDDFVELVTEGRKLPPVWLESVGMLVQALGSGETQKAGAMPRALGTIQLMLEHPQVSSQYPHLAESASRVMPK